MDRLELRGLRAVGTHGALREERARSQPFEVDLDVELDLREPGSTDSIRDTLDYGSVAEMVAAIVQHERHALLERLAARITEEVLADPRVVQVTVTIRKLRPPVPVDLASAGVTITRARTA